MKQLITLVALISSIGLTYAQTDGEFHLNKEYKINAKGTIDLSSSDAKVFITGSNRTNAHVKIDRKVTSKGIVWGESSFKVDVEENDGNLSIKEKSQSNLNTIGSYREEYRIDIEAPEGVSLKVRGDDGDYYIKNINGAISLSLDDADAELADCNGDKFHFRMDDGDIRMNKGRGFLEIDADDADVEIRQSQFVTIHADFDDGDFNIETSLSDKGDYDINAQDGLVAMTITSGGGEFDIRHDDGHVVTQGNFKTTRESESHSVITLVSGSARVNVRADDAHVRLTTN